jgi:hypothetical protein
MKGGNDHPNPETWQTPPPHVPTSCRPINLLPILFKVLEKLLLEHLLLIVQNKQLLPDHQFGFQQGQSTNHQTHRNEHVINTALESKQYCSAAFLDISQSGMSVSYSLPASRARSNGARRCYSLRWLARRQDSRRLTLRVKLLCGRFPHLLHTSDLPTSPDTITATFTDDTAVLAMDPDPTIASHKLQTSLLAIQIWLTKWRLKASGSKSPSLLGEQHVVQSTSTTNNFHKQKRLATLVYIWTDDSHGTSTFLPSGNTSESLSPSFTGCSVISPDSLLATNYYSTRSSSNLSGPMAYNSGDRLPLPISKSFNASNPKLMHHGTCLMWSSDRISKSLQLKKKSDDSALITVPENIHIPTASQFILRNHQNTNDWNDTCQLIWSQNFKSKCIHVVNISAIPHATPGFCHY